MFSSFFLPASLPNNSAPSLSNYTKSPILTESQLHQLSEDQHKLAAEMTLCALFIMYMCVCVELGGTGVGRNWCERFTAEGNPAWPSFQSVSLVTVAFRKLLENEGGKMLYCPKMSLKLGTRFYLWDWTGCTKPTWRIIRATEALLWDRVWRKYLTREQHWVSEPGLECVNIINQLH